MQQYTDLPGTDVIGKMKIEFPGSMPGNFFGDFLVIWEKGLKNAEKYCILTISMRGRMSKVQLIRMGENL